MYICAVKPVLTTTSEQRPPANNDQPKSPVNSSYWQIHWRKFNHPLYSDYLFTTATFLGSRGWSLYTGLTVYLIQIDRFLCKYELIIITPNKIKWKLDTEGTMLLKVITLGQRATDNISIIGIGCSFKNRSFGNLSWPPPTGGVGGWKNNFGVYSILLG